MKLTHVKIFVFSVTCSLGKKFKMMTRSKYKKQFAFLDVNEAPSEETLRDQEANILQLGEKLREEGKTKEMTDLIQKVRHFLRFMSKARGIFRRIHDSSSLKTFQTKQDKNGIIHSLLQHMISIDIFCALI